MASPENDRIFQKRCKIPWDLRSSWLRGNALGPSGRARRVVIADVGISNLKILET